MNNQENTKELSVHILQILNDYDREFKNDTFAYTRPCSFTVEEWWTKKQEKIKSLK